MRAHDLVGDRPERLERRCRADRYREHDVARAAGTQAPDRGVTRPSGRDAVVDEEDGPVPHVDRRATVTELPNALFDLLAFRGDELRQLPVFDAEQSRRLAVDVDRVVLGDRPDAELRIHRRAELPHDARVERRVELTRDLVRDRDAAAREPHDDGIGRTERCEQSSQHLSRFASIPEQGAWAHAP